ncbi:hypothetical protein EXIGLDRAFT_776188 [Exidia glandulosa HHB12029]|uniref:Glycoside hydrolase family 92 protein n=1 Tax=Exidia glandulosa HHB12029 TaxID=1314781 RepID=A0A165ZPU2_EXIGL|nr:hypothetical protein EXIGLDRAFT_776188 [Exidia glandulosa HHB12029]
MLHAAWAVALVAVAGAHGLPSDWVDPFIGTTNGGHVFPGATLPFGSVKAVADCTGNENQGGFVWDDSLITGVSPLHDDGTGGSPSLGQFQVMPQVCTGEFKTCFMRSSERAVARRKGTERAHPGYFGITLDNGLELETTVTSHVALHRFTFHDFKTKRPYTPPGVTAPPTRRQQDAEDAVPGDVDGDDTAEVTPTPQSTPGPEPSVSPTAGSTNPPSRPTKPTTTVKPTPTPPPPQPSAVIVFDLTEDLAHSYKGQGALRYGTTSELGVVRVSGWGQYVPSFGANFYRVYFCLDVPGVKSVAQYQMGGRNFSTVHATPGWGASEPIRNNESGALFEIDPAYLHKHNNTVHTRIGVSWASEKAACAFAEEEIPNGRWEMWSDFEVVKSAGRRTWDDLLGLVEVSTDRVDNDVIIDFWSSMYRSYISPTNITGDHPLWDDSDEPYYDSFYCIWDSFRVVHPLYTITARAAQAEMVRALIDVWRHRGWLPDCRMSLAPGWTQGGSNADSLLADSFVKNITKGIDWNAGLRSMITDATVTPGYWDVEGRSAITRRKELGYVPVDDDTPGGLVTRSASKTLEYAFNDFGIALVAEAFGLEDTAKEYYNASNDWKNLWNPKTTSAGFSGFIQPRYINGSFMEVDPRHCSPVLGHLDCFLNAGGGEFYEASSWEYSFFVPHDMATAVDLMGGRPKFVQRLDAFFDEGFHDIGDEPGFLPCFLYNYGARPDKTVDRVLKVLNANYFPGPAGLPGNDDSGAMGGFVVFASFGFFPVAGESVYLISAPLFPAISFFDPEQNTTARVITHGFDGTKKNKYIQRASLNGRDFTRNWFAHDEFFGVGATLELWLGPRPTKWGTRLEDLPPSMSTGGKFMGMLEGAGAQAMLSTVKLPHGSAHRAPPGSL